MKTEYAVKPISRFCCHHKNQATPNIYTGKTHCIMGPHVKAAIEKMMNNFAGKVLPSLFQ